MKNILMTELTIKELSTKQIIQDLHDSGGHPHETNEASDRFVYIEELARRGFKNILLELGYSTDENTMWRNRYTGSEQTLESLLTPTEYGAQYRAETKDNQFPYVLESWIPAVGRNTIKEEFDREQNQKEVGKQGSGITQLALC